VLSRRFNSRRNQDPYPDLLMVDGGKGQLNIAVAVLDGLGLGNAFDVIGIAKKDEARGEKNDKIYKTGRMNPVALNRDYELLLFLQKIRDEAHRFAITFHRKQRSRMFIRSELDVIQGVGKKRKAVLLKHFGSVQGVRTASLEQIASLPGMNAAVARAIKNGLVKE